MYVKRVRYEKTLVATAIDFNGTPIRFVVANRDYRVYVAVSDFVRAVGLVDGITCTGPSELDVEGKRGEIVGYIHMSSAFYELHGKRNLEEFRAWYNDVVKPRIATLAHGRLVLVLNYSWYDMIVQGLKTVEYRAIKDFWKERLWARRDLITNVTFLRGFTEIGVCYPVKKIDIGECPYPGWDGDYYRVHF